MGKLAANIVKRLADDLEDGESIVAATKAQLEGGTLRIGISVATTGELDRGGGAEDLSRGAIVAVTDRRVLVVKVTATFQPERIALSIPFDELERVEAGSKRVMLVKMSTITLESSDGQAVTFEVPRVNARDAQAVVDAIQEAGVT